jgi:hypothetical protein
MLADGYERMANVLLKIFNTSASCEIDYDEIEDCVKEQISIMEKVVK